MVGWGGVGWGGVEWDGAGWGREWWCGVGWGGECGSFMYLCCSASVGCPSLQCSLVAVMLHLLQLLLVPVVVVAVALHRVVCTSW